MSAADATIWTIAALLKWTESHFAEKGLESPLLDAQILLAHALGLSRPQLYVRHDVQPSESELARFRPLVTKRAAGTPVAYLVGFKEFFLLSFEVTPDVLIPRPSTETLVMAALKILNDIPNPRILDVGTGSGCIAISIASRHKTALVTATDISEATLAIAARNANKHRVADRVTIATSDLFGALTKDRSFDLIVSNPPYIPTGDIASLAIDVRDHEPRLALDGGADGFVVLERILADAALHLKPGGWLLLEVGSQQSAHVAELSKANGWKHLQTINDADAIPRVVVLRSSQMESP